MEGLGEHGEHRIGNERHFRRLRVEEEVYQKYYNLCFSYIYFKISDFFFPFFQEAKIEQDGCGEQHLCPSRTTQGNSDSTTPDECREKEEIQIYLWFVSYTVVWDQISTPKDSTPISTTLESIEIWHGSCLTLENRPYRGNGAWNLGLPNESMCAFAHTWYIVKKMPSHQNNIIIISKSI